MKRYKFHVTLLIVFSLLLSVLLSGCNSGSASAVPTPSVSVDNTPLMTVNGVTIYNRDYIAKVNMYLATYSQQGVEVDQTTPEGKAFMADLQKRIMKDLVRFEIMREMAEKAGYLKFTDAEEAKMKSDFESNLKKSYDNFVKVVASVSPGLDPAKQKESAAVNLWRTLAMTKDQQYALYRQQMGVQKYLDSFNANLTEQQAYDLVKNTHKKTFENTKVDTTTGKTGPQLYEQAVINQDLVLYNLPGYIRFKQILLSLKDSEKEQISTWRNEALNKDGSVNATKNAQVDTKRDQLVKDKLGNAAKMIQQRLQSGESFDQLMIDFGDDTNMTTGITKSFGYIFGPTSSPYKQFTQAALALKNVGDVSNAVITDQGYHFIKLIAKITPGFVPLSSLTADQKKELITSANDITIQEMISEQVSKAKIVEK